MYMGCFITRKYSLTTLREKKGHVGSAREKSKEKEKESGADMKSGGLDMKSSPKGWDQHEVGPGVGHGVGGRVVVAGRRCRGSSGLR
jgi:hypothetical protein